MGSARPSWRRRAGEWGAWPATLRRNEIRQGRAPRADQGCGSLPEPSAFIIATVNQRVPTAGTARRSPGDPPHPHPRSERRQGRRGVEGRGGKCALSGQARREDPQIRHQACGCLSLSPPRGCAPRRRGCLVVSNRSVCLWVSPDHMGPVLRPTPWPPLPARPAASATWTHPQVTARGGAGSAAPPLQPSGRVS